MPLAALTRSFGLAARRQAGWVGVDLGSHSLKVAQLQLANGKKQIAEAAIIPLPSDARLTPESIRTGWLQRALKKLVTQAPSLRGQSVACGLSFTVTEFRSLSIPPGSHDERREMIAQELAQDAAVPSGEQEFDFWSGESNSADPAGQNSVNLLRVSRDLVHEVVEALYRAKLYCETLDGGPFILARAAALAAPSSRDCPTAVLDWGHGESQLVVAMNGQPAFTRVLKGCSLQELVAAVGRGLQLMPAESQQVLAKYGISDPSAPTAVHPLQEHVAELAEPFLHQLKLELGRTLAYLKHQRPHLLPERVCLVGGAASIRNIAARLTAECEIPFAVWSMDYQPAALSNQQSLGLLAQAAALSDLGWAA